MAKKTEKGGEVPAGKEILNTRKSKWKNRERVMVFCSRGASYRDRHLMEDFRVLFPHAKSESKMDKNVEKQVIDEICEMRNCSKCLYFETKKKQDVYLWMSNTTKGPSAKFLLHNIHTMGELKMSGNCLKGSRPILSFSQVFEKQPHLLVLKELFTQVFSTPNHHPRSQPFTDHIFAFSVTPDKKIWFRNYQIVDESNGKLEEIGPRMVLELIAIFEGSFSGPVLFQNSEYVNPNICRRQAKLDGGRKYVQKLEARKSLEVRKAELKPVEKDPLDAVFETEPTKRSRDNDSSDDDNDEQKNSLTKEAAILKKQIEKRNLRKRKKKKTKSTGS